MKPGIEGSGIATLSWSVISVRLFTMRFISELAVMDSDWASASFVASLSLLAFDMSSRSIVVEDSMALWLSGLARSSDGRPSSR